MGLRPIRYKLVRGTSRTIRHKAYNWTVPRSYMFSMLDGASGSDRIIIDPRLDLAKELTEELKNLQLEQDQEPATSASRTAKASTTTSLFASRLRTGGRASPGQTTRCG
jgi:hypothetical protein